MLIMVHRLEILQSSEMLKMMMAVQSLEIL
jgi:hypothetical protein